MKLFTKLFLTLFLSVATIFSAKALVYPTISSFSPASAIPGTIVTITVYVVKRKWTIC